MGSESDFTSSQWRSDKKPYRKAHLWFKRNESELLAIDVVCITLLFFLYLFTSVFQIFMNEIVNTIHILALTLVSFLAVSLVYKGLVPIMICVIGAVLIQHSLILPYYSGLQLSDTSFAQVKLKSTFYIPTAVSMAAGMNYFLGLSMVAFSLIIAYRPSLLFTRNRPESLATVWSKYPLWHDNILLAHSRMESSIPIKSLMTDQDRYLLWRYEYVLANIYGIPHLVRPGGYVPKNSTSIYRDKESSLIMGKARYTGYFI